MLRVLDETKKCEITSLKVSKMLLEEGVIWHCANYARIESKKGKYLISEFDHANDTFGEGFKNGYVIPAFDVRFMGEWLLYSGKVMMSKSGGLYEVRLEDFGGKEIYFGSAKSLPDAMGMCMIDCIRRNKKQDGMDAERRG
jgi:hypothetical protein